MRRILGNAKAACILIAALLCALLAYVLCNSPVFESGESYEFYRGNSSSAEIISSKNPVLDKLLHAGIEGESVRYTGNRYESIKSRFHAKLLFTEEACGVTNYYLYSPVLDGGVWVMGELVNLHIAVGSERTAAGTPLIFGGF